MKTLDRVIHRFLADLRREEEMGSIALAD